MLGIVIVGFVGAAGLMCLQQQPLSVKSDIAKRPTEGLVKVRTRTHTQVAEETNPTHQTFGCPNFPPGRQPPSRFEM